MKNSEKGFTLLEILIAIVILGIIAAMNNQLLTRMILGSRQQERIVSTQFESALGLEMMRMDIEQAGFGLPDQFSMSCLGCLEAASAPANAYNMAGNQPPAISFGDQTAFAGYIQFSDYLVIRSPAVGMNAACGKWTYIDGTRPHQWFDANRDMTSAPQNYMIVIKPRTRTSPVSQLVMKADNDFAVQYSTATDLDAAYQPVPTQRYIAYGVEDANVPVRPYNRADYYVRIVSTTSPSCAPNTGTLIKGVLNSAGGITEYPLIDCVANMQVLFRIDTNGDGVPDQTVSNLATYGTPPDPNLVRQYVKEIRVYILAHEGTLDRSFNYNTPDIVVGDSGPPILGYTVNLPTLVGADWAHYRWKLYSFSVKPREFYSALL